MTRPVLAPVRASGRAVGVVRLRAAPAGERDRALAYGRRMSRTRGLGAIAVVIALWAVSYGVASSRPASGEYVGTGGQGLPFKLTVAEDRATLTLDVRWRCERGVGVKMFRQRSVALGGDGDFSWAGRNVSDGGGSDEEDRQRLRIDGHHSADGTLRGTWRADHEFYNGPTRAVEATCSSGDVPFTVRRRDGPAGTDGAGNRVIALDGDPARYGSVAAGAGRVWVVRTSDRAAVLEIDPSTGAIGAQHAIGDYGYLHLAAGEAAAWLVTPVIGRLRDGERLVRIDARTGRVARVTLPQREPGVWDLAVGAGGVWLHDGDRVLRADPRSGRIVRAIRLRAPRPRRDRLPCGEGGRGGSDSVDETITPDHQQANLVGVAAGAVWVMTNCGPGASRFGFLQRIDPRANRVTRAVALRAAYDELAAGPQSLWAATINPNNERPSLHRIGVRDGRPAAVTLLPAGYLTALAADGRAVWLTQQAVVRHVPVGALRRVGPTTTRLKSVLELEEPTSVAVGDDAVWVLDAFARTVTRVRR